MSYSVLICIIDVSFPIFSFIYGKLFLIESIQMFEYFHFFFFRLFVFARLHQNK